MGLGIYTSQYEWNVMACENGVCHISVLKIDCAIANICTHVSMKMHVLVNYVILSVMNIRTHVSMKIMC